MLPSRPSARAWGRALRAAPNRLGRTSSLACLASSKSTTSTKRTSSNLDTERVQAAVLGTAQTTGTVYAAFRDVAERAARAGKSAPSVRRRRAAPPRARPSGGPRPGPLASGACRSGCEPRPHPAGEAEDRPAPNPDRLAGEREQRGPEGRPAKLVL